MLLIWLGQEYIMDIGKKEDDDMKDLFGIMTAVMTITAMFVWGVTALAARAAAVGRTGGRNVLS
jgi:hypothetical protein